jgi:hypothetical protein
MRDNVRTLVPRLPGWLPVPPSVRDHGFTNRYIATGVAAVGLVIAAAAVRGYQTQGRSAFYQNALLVLQPRHEILSGVASRQGTAAD